MENQISSIVGDSINNLSRIYNFSLEQIETTKDQRNATFEMVLNLNFGSNRAGLLLDVYGSRVLRKRTLSYPKSTPYTDDVTDQVFSI